MDVTTMFWIAGLVYLGAMFYVALLGKARAEKSASEFMIAGKGLGFWRSVGTMFATGMGAANFIGHGGSAFRLGLGHLPYALGEQGAAILGAFVIGPFAGKFSYATLAELMDDLFYKDKVSRGINALFLLIPSICWVGGQAIGVGAIYQMMTGKDPLPIIIISSLLFIAYTAMSGMWGVVDTDVLQGIVCLVFGAVFYVLVFSGIDWDFGAILSRAGEIRKSHLDFWSTGSFAVFSRFLTGVTGAWTVQNVWQRYFAAKNPRIARDAKVVAGIGNLVLVLAAVFVGIIVFTIDPTMPSDQANVYAMLRLVPQWFGALAGVLILASTMSTADSNLHAGCTLILNDIIKPSMPHLTDAQQIRIIRILIIVCGLFALIVALAFPFVLAAGMWGYAASGGAIIPALALGLWWKDKNGKTRVTKWGARIGIIGGGATAILFQSIPSLYAIFTGGIIPGLVVSVILLVVVSLFTGEASIPKNLPLKG